METVFELNVDCKSEEDSDLERDMKCWESSDREV